MLLDDARSTYDLNIDREEKLAGQRKLFWQQTGRQEALAKVRQVSGIRSLAELPKKKVTVAETLDPTEQPLRATE